MRRHFTAPPWGRPQVMPPPLAAPYPRLASVNGDGNSAKTMLPASFSFIVCTICLVKASLNATPVTGLHFKLPTALYKDIYLCDVGAAFTSSVGRLLCEQDSFPL
ncbi:hypothetical protein TcWFU_001765 [Taenia crassiceps]|uniref:Uncharacterized protein n=1 Tax=Taenia crassiceps TaxID=6207 RepID=A0ABR4Q2R0_9CEST